MKQSNLEKAINIIRRYGPFKGLKIIMYKISKDIKYADAGALAESLSLVNALDLDEKQVEANQLLQKQFMLNRGKVDSVNWLIPYFEHAYYGGIYTILRFASFFKDKGATTRLILYDNPSVTENKFKQTVSRAFPSLSSAEFIIYRGLDVNSLPYSDVTICTLWTSAYLLARFSNTRGKFYFVQDYEPLFYPAGTFYALAEATYEMNFHCIVNTPGLYEFLVQKHGIYGEYFTPAVDTDLFYPVESLENKGNDRLKLFVYGRPHHDRNAFELAVATIHKLKQRLGDRIEIISAGSEWEPADYGLEGMVNNMGLIPMDKTADIYRQCDLGLVFMFTKHPSYLPLELMASGCVVVTNENSANRWLFDGKNALLVKPFPSYIVDKITGIINKKEEMQRIAQNALSTIKRLSWKGQMEKIWNFILKGRDNDILCDS